MVIGLHVVGVDIGDHRHHGHEVKKRAIGLVGLGHEGIPQAKPRIGACAVKPATNYKGGVLARLSQQRGHKASGGGLSVRACNGNTLLHAHQFTQHKRAWNNRRL